MKSDNLTNEAIELLKRLIETPSISRNEKEAADIIESFLLEKGLDAHRHGNNVWSICPDYREGIPTVLLNAHIDTVKPVAGWTHDPFTAEMTEDGRIFGLGSNDDGGSVVSLLQTYLYLCSHKTIHCYNVVFLASCEEEISGKNGIESVLPLLPEIDLGVVGEPTDMQPATAEKGLMVIDVTAYGRAGHAARDEGDNAIYKVLDDIQWISTHRFPKSTELLGPVKATVTVINAGTQHNVVPDKCTFTIDVRSNECYSNEELFEEISAHLKCEAKARSFRLNSSRIGHDHPFVIRCKELGMKPFGSPTLSDQALMRFPSVKIGPGSSTRSHTADEFIKVQEIEDAIKLYIKIFEGLHIEKRN